MSSLIVGGSSGVLPDTRLFRYVRNKPLVAVLLLAIALRVALALVTDQANDPHIDLIRFFLDEGRFPDASYHRLAFHPKLYHLSVISILAMLNWVNLNLISGPIPEDVISVLQILTANLVSCLAGIGTLLVLMRWLQHLQLSPKTKVLVFSLFALNTKMIAVNGQATNDSFVIFFSSLSLYYGYLFLADRTTVRFTVFTVAAVLAGLSKGSGLVIPIVYVTVLALAMLRPCPPEGLTRGRALIWAVVFISVYVAALPFLGPFKCRGDGCGSPFQFGYEPPPPPALFEKTEVLRPGIRSIAEGFLTFDLVGLLREPSITNHPTEYVFHRTSHWSQVYGRLHFTHFDNWPPVWQTTSAGIRNMGRLILVVALLPTALLVAGIFREGFDSLRWLSGRPPEHFGITEVMMSVAVFGHLAFSVAYACYCRDFSCLKAVFLFPGVLGFAWCYARAYGRFESWSTRVDKRFLAAFNSLVVALCALYVTEIITLVLRLAANVVATRF